MTTADALVAHALTYRGVTENPAGSNCNPFSAYLNRPCQYWCADFIAAVMAQVGAPVPRGADTASTRMNLAAWKKAGRWVGRGDIRPGDILFFHISGRNGNNPDTPDHTGICIETLGGNRVRTVEGNTSADDHGSQDNGGGVFARTRNLGVVIGAGRPDYQENNDMPLNDADKQWIRNTIQEVVSDNVQWVLGIGDHAGAGARLDQRITEIKAAVDKENDQ